MFLCAFAIAQEGEQPEITPQKPVQPQLQPEAQPRLRPGPLRMRGPQRTIGEVVIPAGTHIPIALKNTISTKSNREGDPIYAQSTFPVAINDQIIVPVGTYVQGKIISIKPAGHIKGRAEVLIHFTSLIYPSGYTVMLPGAIENAPGIDNAKVKDQEGTIQGDSNKGKTAATIAGPAANGALIGAVARGGEGALIGAGIGGAIGTTIAALSHGNEVKMGPGTTLEVVLQRDVAVDGSRISTRMGRAILE
jgi:type IV secretion system protein VirB10